MVYNIPYIGAFFWSSGKASMITAKFERLKIKEYFVQDYLAAGVRRMGRRGTVLVPAVREDIRGRGVPGLGIGRGRGRPRTSIFGNFRDVQGRGRRRPEEAWQSTQNA